MRYEIAEVAVPEIETLRPRSQGPVQGRLCSEAVVGPEMLADMDTVGVQPRTPAGAADVARSLNETLRVAAGHERLVFLCSFQKEESVILDELLRVAPHVRVVTIDTGVLFAQTVATWRAFEEHFGVQIAVERAVGSPPWTGPEHCCGSAKVAALERALAGADAWVTGLRREQGPSRAATELVETDLVRGGIAKYNPLALWTERDLWARIHERKLPYHPLHDEGYASIGCAPCTQPGGGRDGRWAGTNKSECGLHT